MFGSFGTEMRVNIVPNCGKILKYKGMATTFAWKLRKTNKLILYIRECRTNYILLSRTVVLRLSCALADTGPWRTAGELRLEYHLGTGFQSYLALSGSKELNETVRDYE